MKWLFPKGIIDGYPHWLTALFNLYLYHMRKVMGTLIIVFLCLATAVAQNSYLKRPDLLARVDSCLQP